MNVAANVARGAVWMISLRLLERSIGFVSTLILARLLMPEDFGLVAMAMTVFAFVELAGQFGFDLALIRDRKAERVHYDSAWSLQVASGVVMCAALALLAAPMSHYFAEPRLVPVLLVLAGVALAQSFENIGTVNFRKEFAFAKDFQLMLGKKLVAFVVTIALAVATQSYWALLGGIVASRLSGLALSYLMSSYRPRFDFRECRALLRFSRWIVLRSLVDYLIERGPDLIIGRMLNVSTLGFYRVSREIATLPTTELIFPVMRAVFPGYAAVAADRQRLADAFLQVQSFIVYLALPVGIGLVLLAEPVVGLLLGAKWADVVPLVQILGVYGAITVFQATNLSIFNVLGRPQWGAGLKALEALLLLPAVYWAVANQHGISGAAWAIVLAQLAVIPLGMALISRLLQIGFRRRLAVSWRPLVGTLAMGAALLALRHLLGAPQGALACGVQLASGIAVGASVYLISTFGLWRISGTPNGAESRIAHVVRSRLLPT
ncbi:MAG: lipopolysaccharide biosynthesis protein [Aquabacterium sp.]|nr:lipopolysaccharide biosynthesis protein [Aquabacterium sp.]